MFVLTERGGRNGSKVVSHINVLYLFSLVLAVSVQHDILTGQDKWTCCKFKKKRKSVLTRYPSVVFLFLFFSQDVNTGIDKPIPD